jgi:4-alpha-glucanotransferase
MSDAMRRLARAAGVAPEWEDFRGARRDVAPATLCEVLKTLGLECDTDAQVQASLERLAHERDDELPPLVVARAGAAVPLHGAARAGQRVQLLAEDGATRGATLDAAGALPLPADLAPGYYRVALAARELAVAVTPAAARGVAEVAPPGRAWALAAQLYALRRRGDGGAGDYTALAQCAAAAGRAGADALCVSPVHALFDADPGHFSPYAPSSRLLYDTRHVDPAAPLGRTGLHALVRELGLGDELARLEALPLIDWPAVARARGALLRAAFARWRTGAGPAQRRELAAFRADGGETLESHARFEALHAQQLARGGAWHWREWPAALRDPAGPEVLRFAAQQADAVDYQVFAQWQAARGLAAAQAAARDAGMRIGLVGDLAVGTHDGGSHAWSHPEDLLVGLSVGAPPDELNAAGQSWGLTSFSPRALRRHGYGPFIAMLRATLRHAGGLRVDHVLGLNRLWLVPRGASPTEGAYLRYPLDDLLGLVALESWRHHALVIGEDLGTVPAGFRERMDAAGLLGLRVLWFERAHGLYTDPWSWPERAVATTSTHDLPTVRGWWLGRDLDRQARLDRDADVQREQRARERRALWAAFEHAAVASGPPPEDAGLVVDAAVRHVARARSQLAVVPLEDVAGELEQPNVPGTTDEHPNWRRRYAAPAPELLDAPAAGARLASLRRARPR